MTSRISIISLALFLICGSALASRTTDEILTRLQGCIEEGRSTSELIEGLTDIPDKELKTLLTEYDKTWTQLRDSYQKAFEAHAKSQYSGSAKTEMNRLVRGYRQDFMKVYAMGEAAMKEPLKKTSMPAVKALRKLLMPTAKEILSTAPPALQKQRKIVRILAKFRDAILEAAVIGDGHPSHDGIINHEKNIVGSLGGLPRDGFRIMKKNDTIAKKANVPEKERQGVREVNEWRLLLGMNALVLDPKLCDASRGHSEDMNKEGFFAHDSPVPGKETPWKRAAKAGTKAAGENIYMGSQSPAAANKAWFFSPGHHLNMFKSKHTRIGLGQYERHWTQLFG